VRPRPILAPLRLIGQGTPLVESLEHFGARLGHAHNISPAQVLTLARNVARQLHYGTRVRSYNYTTICGYGPFSAAMVASLTRLTGEPGLAGATFGVLRKVLTETLSGCFHGTRRWCPQCYQREGDDRYDLLAWQMITMSHCPRDGRRLESTCPSCGACQPDFRAWEVRNHCQACRAELGHATSLGAAPTAWEAWSNAASLDLLEFTSQGGRPLRGNPWREYLQWLRASGRLPADVNLEAFRAFTWKTQWRKPRLSTLFQYAALNAVMPLQVLQNPVVAASPLLPLAQSVVARPPEDEKPFGWQHQKLRCAAAALVAGAGDWPLPYPGWLARAFGCERPSWSAADPQGYSAYVKAFRTSGSFYVDRRVFASAVMITEAGLSEGGAVAVAAVRDTLQAAFPRATTDTIARNLLRAMLTVGMVRQLCPGSSVTLKRTRERAGKPRREHY